VSATPETLQAGLRGPTFAAFAMVLVACGADAGSADKGGQSVASTASSSVEVLGEISAELNGESRTWYVTREYKYGRWISESSPDFRGAGTVFLSGHVSKDTTTNPVDLLMLNAHVRSTDSGPDVQSANITFAGANISLGRYGSGYGGDAIIAFDSISNAGGETRLKGTFSGRLPYKDNSSAGPDVNNIVTLERGEFDVNLVLSE
jgi:hypothetical protein